MHSKMVHFNIKTQNLELVNLKCVTYAQTIHLSLTESKYLQHMYKTKLCFAFIKFDSIFWNNSVIRVGMIEHGGIVVYIKEGIDYNEDVKM